MTMNKTLMLQMLEHRMDAYRQHRPATAEMDIAIVRAYCRPLHKAGFHGYPLL